MFSVALILSALADTAGTITGTDIAGFIMPTIQAVVSALILYGMGRLFVLLKSKLGVLIDDSMREWPDRRN